MRGGQLVKLEIVRQAKKRKQKKTSKTGPVHTREKLECTFEVWG